MLFIVIIYQKASYLPIDLVDLSLEFHCPHKEKIYSKKVDKNVKNT